MKPTWSNDSDSSSNDEKEHVTNMCFLIIESDYKESKEYGEWFLDGAYSKLMTGDDLFSSMTKI
jgi:hypothetical protein